MVPRGDPQGGDLLPIELSPPTERHQEVGLPVPDPGDRAGARTQEANESEKRSKFGRAHDAVQDSGEKVAGMSADLVHDFRALMNAKDPDMCIPMSQSYPEVGVPPAQRPDAHQAATSLFDTAVIVFDAIYLGVRKVRGRDRD